MKNISIMWGLICITLFGILTFFGFYYEKIDEYLKLKSDMENTVEAYYKDVKVENILDLYYNEDEIKMMNDSLSFEVNNDTCNGYVIGKIKNNNIKYEAFIKCREYTSKNYEERIDEN